MESVERTISLPTPPDEAWQLVVDLGQWFASDVTGHVALGEVPRIDGRRAVIERMDELSRLTFRWLGEDPSRVDITLSEAEDGTIVSVIETRIEAAVTPTPEIGFKALART
jgi:hypothetical protein